MEAGHPLIMLLERETTLLRRAYERTGQIQLRPFVSDEAVREDDKAILQLVRTGLLWTIGPRHWGITSTGIGYVEVNRLCSSEIIEIHRLIRQNLARDDEEIVPLVQIVNQEMPASDISALLHHYGLLKHTR